MRLCFQVVQTQIALSLAANKPLTGMDAFLENLNPDLFNVLSVLAAKRNSPTPQERWSLDRKKEGSTRH
jgi:hypothetical protein